MGSTGTVGLGDFPATYSTGSTSCNDFAVFNTGLTGASGQASIIAYRNLYSTCNGGVPTAYWAYNTGGTITNAVVLSVDGSQVGFVQSVSGVATWSCSSGQAVALWVLQSPRPPWPPTSYRGSCTALPCMTTIALSGSPSDTYSFPYYDYATDTVYAGDDGGKLHKFTSIFRSGTPIEAPSPWPVTVFPTTSVNLVWLRWAAPSMIREAGRSLSATICSTPRPRVSPRDTASTATCGYLYSVLLVDGSGHSVSTSWTTTSAFWTAPWWIRAPARFTLLSGTTVQPIAPRPKPPSLRRGLPIPRNVQRRRRRHRSYCGTGLRIHDVRQLRQRVLYLERPAHRAPLCRRKHGPGE